MPRLHQPSEISPPVEGRTPACLQTYTTFPRYLLLVLTYCIVGSFSQALFAKEAPTKKQAPDNNKVSDLIDQMPQNSLQEAFRHLQKDYIQKEKLNYDELNRATLQGLLERLDFGATLLTKNSRAARNSPFRFLAQDLTPQAAYIRLGQYTSAEILQLDQALDRFTQQAKLHTLILDLRSPQAQADFEIAAQFLSRFLPADRLLFKNKLPQQKRPHLFFTKPSPQQWQRNLILLIDRDTGNAGEIIAAVLQQRTDCLIIGEKTPGMTVEYRDVSLGQNRILRYAIAEIILDNNTSLFQKGVSPDLIVRYDKSNKYAVFKKSEQAPLKSFIFDQQRPRMNEASLVARTDPELDYYLDRTAGRLTHFDKKPLQDPALQQAIDYLTTAQFLHSSQP